MERVKQIKAKQKKTTKKIRIFKIIHFFIGVVLGAVILGLAGVIFFEQKYKNSVYPGIKVGGLDASGKSKEEIEDYFTQKSFPFLSVSITFQYEDTIATISGRELNVSYDGKLSADQAFLVGRSDHLLSNIFNIIKASKSGIYLPVMLKLNTQAVDDFFTNLSASINIEPEDALFKFEGGRVSAFKISKAGRKLNIQKNKQLLNGYLKALVSSYTINNYSLYIPLAVDILEPAITTENSNNYGVKELLGRGQSKFAHSIAGRIHNIALAASRISGHLIAPGNVFSFNDALGDVSATTGFEPAYIIKDGRTVLGDGGGVCQVSTTLFRAALNAGLPITERFAHDYRVGYYEQDSPPGLDATVYAPSYDLKIKNDTTNYILIQAETDVGNTSLAFSLYGTKDGRQAEITTPRVYSQSPPPPDLYQDDPTLTAGTVKQTDFAAWGAKVDFNYKVIRNGQVLSEKNFFSNYRPWQAIFLKGTKT